jgi:thiamine-monophosphate kinase
VSARRAGSRRGARARAIGDLDEFELIARIERAAGRAGLRVSLGIGDDAALLRARGGADWAVSTDVRVEDVHFRWRTESARTVGRTALVAALSDLAAMGASPRGFTWSLAAPPALPLARFDGLVAGVLAESRRHGCPLVGGNLTRARETSLGMTVVGDVAPGLALRRQARIGDRVLVTGALGASALARARAECESGTLRRVPTPRLAEGRALARLRGVRGCIDVSDGLLADLGHLLGPDRHCRLDPARLPRPRGFDAACGRLGLDPIALALGGGDDYELLFTVAPGGPSAALVSRRLGLRVTELGPVVRGAPAGTAAGWRHYASGRPGSCA